MNTVYSFIPLKPMVNAKPHIYPADKGILRLKFLGKYSDTFTG